jgi:ferredoxin/flavodoxin---NADP+ reductase
MQKYDVIIIGGGVSGLACAITLGSAGPKMDIAADKNILVIDAGKSHLNMAELHNVPGVAEGTKGPELLASLSQRAEAYENVTLMQGTVASVSGAVGAFSVTTESSETFEADIVVFANGMQTIAVEGIGAAVVDHIRAPRPGMVMIENDNGVISEGKYVTGCAAGASSMFASAAGYGAQTATDILSLWAGKYTVVHDVLKKG